MDLVQTRKEFLAVTPANIKSYLNKKNVFLSDSDLSKVITYLKHYKISLYLAYATTLLTVIFSQVSRIASISYLRNVAFISAVITLVLFVYSFIMQEKCRPTIVKVYEEAQK